MMPKTQNMDATPTIFLHGFESSCLEWRYAYPLIEAAGVESWALHMVCMYKEGKEISISNLRFDM